MIDKCLKEMRSAGVHVVYGKWLIDGFPSVILFDVDSVLHRLNEWKSDLWTLASIPSPSNDLEMNGSILLGYLVAWFMGLVRIFLCLAKVILRFSIAKSNLTRLSLLIIMNGSLRLVWF